MKELQGNNSKLASSNTEFGEKSRRRFIKGSTAGPIIMAVQSRTVWAAGCSVSGQLSGSDYDTSNNNCVDPITGRSPGYWGNWIRIYDKIKKYPTYGELVAAGKEAAFTRTGEGNAINVLYNWSLASANTTLIDLRPTANSGYYGDAILNTSDQDLRHLTAALLSAAHPNSSFPYPHLTWSVEYIIQKSLSDDSGTLFDLVRSFFDYPSVDPAVDHLDAGMEILGRNSEDAYNWAKQYLSL